MNSFVMRFMVFPIRIMSADSQMQFDILDKSISEIRIVLLVQIGKEGWDCRTIGIAEVESLCNKRISYEMNFLIGNICDLIEVDGENEEQVDQRNILTLLQKKVKYGVPNMTAISICESVFNDRLLAIELAQILSDANIGTDKILNMLKAHSEEIFSCLDSYPEYFKDRLSVLMK